MFRGEIFLGFHYWPLLSHKEKQSKARFLFTTSFRTFSLSCYSITWTFLLSCCFVMTPNSLQTHCFQCFLHCCTLYFFLQHMQTCIWLTGNTLSFNGITTLKIFTLFRWFYLSLVPNHWWKCWVLRDWRAHLFDAEPLLITFLCMFVSQFLIQLKHAVLILCSAIFLIRILNDTKSKGTQKLKCIIPTSLPLAT